MDKLRCIVKAPEDDALALILTYLELDVLNETISFVCKRWNNDILPTVWQDVCSVPEQYISEFKKSTPVTEVFHKNLCLQWSRRSLKYLLLEPKQIHAVPFYINWRLYVIQESITFNDKTITMQATPNESTRNPITLELSTNATKQLMSLASGICSNIEPMTVLKRMFCSYAWDKHVTLPEETLLLIPNLVEVHGMCTVTSSSISVHTHRFELVDKINNQFVNVNESEKLYNKYLSRHDIVPDMNHFVGCTISGEGVIDPTYRDKAPITMRVQTPRGELPITLHSGDKLFRSKIGIHETQLNVIDNVPLSGFSYIKFQGKLLSTSMDVALDRIELERVGVHGPNILICFACILIFGWIMTQGWFLSREYSAILGASCPSDDLMKQMLLWVRFAVTVPLTVIPGFLACLGISGLYAEVTSVIRQVKYRVDSICI
jgi:hypothetical protein